LTLSVCPDVCPSVTLLQIASSFLLLDGIKHFFGRQFSMCPSTKLFFFRFLILACKAQNLLPKICTKSLISWLVWQIDRRCVGLPGGFGGWPIQWNHAKCCGSDPCCHGNEIWTRRRDPVAYRLVLCYVLCSCFKQHEYGMSEHSSHLNAVIRPTVKCTVKSDIKL